jgi:hypothetical protein
MECKWWLVLLVICVGCQAEPRESRKNGDIEYTVYRENSWSWDLHSSSGRFIRRRAIQEKSPFDSAPKESWQDVIYRVRDKDYSKEDLYDVRIVCANCGCVHWRLIPRGTPKGEWLKDSECPKCNMKVEFK